MEMVTKYVHSGGGYLGICAGAFLAGADAYDGCNNKRSIVGATLQFVPGQGEAQVTFTPKGREILGIDAPTVAVMPMYYSNGCLFSPSKSLKNEKLKLTLPSAENLIEFKKLVTSKTTKTSFESHSGAAISSLVGKGRVIIFGPHPEASAGFRHIIKNALFWTMNKPARIYKYN
jgi:glutamine amidotransferase-like uncharacterized protein